MRNTLSRWIERKLAEGTASTGTSASSAATWTAPMRHSAPARSSAGTAPSRPASSRCLTRRSGGSVSPSERSRRSWEAGSNGPLVILSPETDPPTMQQTSPSGRNEGCKRTSIQIVRHPAPGPDQRKEPIFRSSLYCFKPPHLRRRLRRRLGGRDSESSSAGRTRLSTGVYHSLEPWPTKRATTVPTVDTDQLVDAQAVAELLGLAQRTSVSVYQKRYPDMPRPCRRSRT